MSTQRANSNATAPPTPPLRRRTLVLGGGIGEAIAQASPGATVLASRSAPRHEGPATHIQLDGFTNPDSVRDAINVAVTQLGGLDTLAICTGTRLRRGRLLEHTEKEWVEAYHHNVISVVHACRHAMPALTESESAVLVIVITAHDTFPNPQVAPYSAAEGALDALTRTLAVDLAPQGIRVFAVAPTTAANERSSRRIRSSIARKPTGAAGRHSIVGGEAARLTTEEASTRIPVVYFDLSRSTVQRILDLIEDDHAQAATYLIETDT